MLPIPRAMLPARPVAAPELARAAAACELLHAHRWTRVGIALFVAAMQSALALLAHDDVARLLPMAAMVAIYGVIVLGLGFLARRGSPAPSVLVTATLTADVALVLAATALGAPSPHAERALLGVMVVVYAAHVCFGRRPAVRAAVLGLAGVLVLAALAQSRGWPLDLPEALWSLAVAAAGTVLVLTQPGDTRRRLRTIVDLLERAERGDFAQGYDEPADVRPDAISRVGRACNRMRAQLATMVLSDPLTGCLNRRGFEQAYAREVARSTRAGSDLALLVLDLDHFKLINDSYGHLAGDEVLRDTGQLLVHACRAGDIVARVGGEEFALLLPDTGATGSFHFAARLCDTVRQHAFCAAAPDSVPIRVTTSIGVASRIPHRGIDDGAVGLSARADTALYAAKRSGRDRVRVWSEELGAAAAAH